MAQLIYGQESQCDLSLTKLTPSAIDSFAYGPGIYGGITNTPSTIIIQLVDVHRRNLTSGGNDAKVTIIGPLSNPSIQSVLSVDNKDGTYSFTYQPFLAGQYIINATLNNNPIWDSPFRPIFVESATCPLKFNSVSGPYLNEAYSSRVIIYMVKIN